MNGFETAAQGFDWGWLIPLGMMALCIFGFKKGLTGRPKIDSSDSASEILDKRYALGEIDLAEYEERLSALSRTRPGVVEPGANR